MATGGIGFGSQIGLELTDFVFVLNSDAAVKKFTQSGSITLGRNISIALGPFGRSAEVGGAVGSKGMVGMFAYSKTRGVFGGRSFEGGMLGERLEANRKMYGVNLTAKELLGGMIPPPPEAEPLMRILNSDYFKSSVSVGSPSPSWSTAELPSADIHQQAAELPGSDQHGMTGGVHELSSEGSSKVAELDSGPQQAVFELPAGCDSNRVYELEATQVSEAPLKCQEASTRSLAISTVSLPSGNNALSM